MGEEQRKDERRHRRDESNKLIAEQKEYTLSIEDLKILNRWEGMLKNIRTRSTYMSAVLKVCDHYKRPIHEIMPEEWIEYVNKVMPMQIVNKEISVSTSRIRYYALTGFLGFYALEHDEYAEIEDMLLNPAHAPTPKVNKYPTASQMAAILKALKENDRQVYIAFLLAYECALSPNEIINLETSSFMRSEDGRCFLSVRGRAKRLIVIRDDLMNEIEEFFMTGGYLGDEWLLHNQYGGQIKASVLQRASKRAQQTVVDEGIILEPYSLMSVRGAAINRFLMSDGAKGTSTARYTGISEAYASQMQSVGLASAVQLPGTRKGYTISDLLNSGKEEEKAVQQKAEGGKS